MSLWIDDVLNTLTNFRFYGQFPVLFFSFSLKIMNRIDIYDT